MIQVDALIALLTLEALMLALGLLAVMVWRRIRSRREVAKQAESLVNRVAEGNIHEVSGIKAVLGEIVADLPNDQTELALRGLAEKQRDFYEHVIRAFLDRDIEKLGSLEMQIKELFKSQGISLAKLAQALSSTDRDRHERELAPLRQRIGQIESELEQAQISSASLSKQLDESLTTLHDVSAEYTRMFGEPKTAELLQQSREQMLEIFRRAASQASLAADAGQEIQDPRQSEMAP